MRGIRNPDKFCECGRQIIWKATTCRWCRPYSTRPPQHRFWDRVDTSGGPDACWPFGSNKGYGRFRLGPIGSPQMGSHEYSWQIHNGPIPDGLWVLHHCDNPVCVNPAHLFVGSNLDNVRDSISKGRRSYQKGAA